MTDLERYYMAEADKLMNTLSRWNYDESSPVFPEDTPLAYSGEGTPWNMIQRTATILLEYAGFTLQNIEELMDFHYETGEPFANGIKFLK